MGAKEEARPKSQLGFTMIELALAIIILCLLIVVAVASIYDHQSRKTKRQAVHRLQEVAEWLHQQKASYPSFAAILPADWSAREEGMKYRISLVSKPIVASDPKAEFPAVGPNTFTLQAVPDDADECGSLLLDQTGRRGVTRPGATVANCWE